MRKIEENIKNQETQTQKSTNSLLLGGAVVVLIVVFGGILLFQKGTQPTVNDTIQNKSVQGAESETNNLESVVVEQKNNPEGEEEITVNIEAGSFYYNPKEIRVKKGQRVRINFAAKDLMHDFNIDELDVDGPIVKAGETATIDFVADKAGEFEYYCSVGQHRQLGQVGNLIVEN